jgi:hypothetical protein
MKPVVRIKCCNRRDLFYIFYMVLCKVCNVFNLETIASTVITEGDLMEGGRTSEGGAGTRILQFLDVLATL